MITGDHPLTAKVIGRQVGHVLLAFNMRSATGENHRLVGYAVGHDPRRHVHRNVLVGASQVDHLQGKNRLHVNVIDVALGYQYNEIGLGDSFPQRKCQWMVHANCMFLRILPA